MSDDLVNRLLDRDFLYDWHVTDYERQSRMEAAAEAAAARILADAEVIKAAEELAQDVLEVQAYRAQCLQGSVNLSALSLKMGAVDVSLSTFRAAQDKVDDE